MMLSCLCLIEKLIKNVLYSFVLFFSQAACIEKFRTVAVFEAITILQEATMKQKHRSV